MDKKIYDAVRERSNECCEVCSKYCGDRLELHHIFRRKVPATVTNCIMLCGNCHRSSEGIHGMNGYLLDIKLKKMAQQKYYDQGLSEDEVRKITGGRIY